MTLGCVQVGQPPATVEPAPGEVQFELAGPGEAALVVPVQVNRLSSRFAVRMPARARLACVSFTGHRPADDSLALGGAVLATEMIRRANEAATSGMSALVLMLSA